jgi:hypothetical protein
LNARKLSNVGYMYAMISATLILASLVEFIQENLFFVLVELSKLIHQFNVDKFNLSVKVIAKKFILVDTIVH